MKSQSVSSAEMRRIVDPSADTIPPVIQARVITCSDAASCGNREDRSGPAVRDLLAAHSIEVDRIVVVPDEVEAIAAAIGEALAAGRRLVVTTGGTGVALRDVTPEATWKVSARVIPGFGELMRATSLANTPMASLSRAQAVTAGSALIVNLPGSVTGAIENLEAILHLVPHALELLAGNTSHAGT